MAQPKATTRYSSSDDEGPSAHKPKRRKGPKACDVCRRKKIRCDPDPSDDPQLPCVNCAVFKTECTYTYVAKKRRTQQAYIDSLHSRLGKLERLLMTVAPDVDLSQALNDSLSLSPTRAKGSPSLPRPPSPLKAVPCPPIGSETKSAEVMELLTGRQDSTSSFTGWRDSQKLAGDETEDEDEVGFFRFIPAPSPDAGGSVPPAQPHRFHGDSSGLKLIHKVFGMKGVGWPEYVSRPDPWETHISLIPQPRFTFPPAPLMDHLIAVFFRCVNTFFPLFHHPTFEADIMDGRHVRQPGFGAVVLLVCAVASRWSEDERVLMSIYTDDEAEEGGKRQGGNDEGEEVNKASQWCSAGWEYYWQVHQRYKRNLLNPILITDMQMMALGCIYLQGTSNSSASWQMAGLGIRLAIEAGAHRRKRPGSGGVLESESWKRAFWILVLLDRNGSATHGRPCAIWEEDIDIDLPLEVDDKYLTEAAGYMQPPDEPARMAYFNSSVKLSQILIGALRTIYPVSKSKSAFHMLGPTWEQDMVAALDSSLNSWIENIPEHLRWDPNRLSDDLTFYQSAHLHCAYNYVQILVHRPYITPSRSRKSGSLAFPSLAICTNAARSCSHILDALLRRRSMLVPQLNVMAFTAAIVLLFNVWGMNRPKEGIMSVRMDWRNQMQDVLTCIRFIESSKERFTNATKLSGILRDLVFVGDRPPPDSVSDTMQGTKRTRGGGTPEGTIERGKASPSSGADTSPKEANSSPRVVNSLPPGPSPSFNERNVSPIMYTPSLGLSTSSGGVTTSSQDFHAPAAACSTSMKPEEIQTALDGYLLGMEYQRQGQGSQLPHQQQFSLQSQYGPQTISNPTSQAQPQAQAYDNLAGLYFGAGAGTSGSLSGSGSAAGSTMSNNMIMDAAQHTLDVWGSAPSGFQWDEWQQFTNVIQNVPLDTGTDSQPNIAFTEQPLPWVPF